MDLNTNLFLLPGHKYCGPFNSLRNGLPTSRVDAACREHDEGYAKLGTRAYTRFNTADQRILDRLHGTPGLPARIVRSVFHVKKALLPKLDEPIYIDPPASTQRSPFRPRPLLSYSPPRGSNMAKGSKTTQKTATGSTSRRRGNGNLVPLNAKTRSRSNIPRMRALPNGNVLMTHTEVFTGNAIPGTTSAFSSIRYPIDIADPRKFPNLSRQAALFEKHRFRWLRFEYEPQVAATEPGWVAIAFTREVGDDKPTSLGDMRVYPCSESGATWERLVCHIPGHDLNNGLELYTRHYNHAGDPRKGIPGELHVARGGQSSSADVGQIVVSYSVELITPAPPSALTPTPNVSAVYDLQGATSLTANVTGSLTVTESHDPLQYALSSGTTINLRPGAYKIVAFFRGTSDTNASWYLNVYNTTDNQYLSWVTTDTYNHVTHYHFGMTAMGVISNTDTKTLEFQVLTSVNTTNADTSGHVIITPI